MTKKVAIVSYPVHYSYKLQPFLKRLKAEQRLILELLDYIRIKGGDVRLKKPCVFAGL